VSAAPSHEKHVRLLDEHISVVLLAFISSGVFFGFYGHSPHQSGISLGGDAKTPERPVTLSFRESMSKLRLENLLQDLDLELETYDVEEYKDGLFDAIFLKTPAPDNEDLMKMAECTLPAASRKRNPLSPAGFLPKQWHEITGVARRIITTKSWYQTYQIFPSFFHCIHSVPSPSLRKLARTV
jgi:hypothetical protein